MWRAKSTAPSSVMAVPSPNPSFPPPSFPRARMPIPASVRDTAIQVRPGVGCFMMRGVRIAVKTT